jgi:hypothetical protein
VNLSTDVKKFTGTLIRIGEASDVAPAGSQGHRILITRDAAREAVNQLENSNLYASLTLDHHDQSRVVGKIHKAWINKRSICVRGVMWKPEVDRIDINCSLAMSADMQNCNIADLRAPIWEVTKMNFIGGTVLKAGVQAYKKTRFRWVT